MKNCILFVCILLTGVLFAQNPTRKYLSHTEENGQMEVATNDGKYIFKYYTEGIIETSFIPKGEEYDQNSHAVIMHPEHLKTTYSYKGEDITYGTKGISVTISTSPFKITYRYKGKELISEKRGYVVDSLKKIEFNITKEEVLYGGGARALGMDRRGYRLELYNKAHYGYENHSELMNFTMPIALSNKRYAIHFDNAPIGFLDLDSKGDNTLSYETISGRMTYQVIAGDSWKSVVKNYTELTGRQPMPPRWAFGNFASRFGYHSERETRQTIDKFFEEKIPVDAVILDLYWFGKDIQGHMGNFEFLKDSFPAPKKMIKDFEKKGVKTILITEPFILSSSNKWKEAVEKNILAVDSVGKPYTYDFYFGNTGLIDIYKPEGKAWFWDVYKKFTKDYGIAGWWGDLGEPEVHPTSLQHATGSADEVHNIYGHSWAQLIAEGYRRDFPDQRPFILMRAGYSGSQRFGMIPWSGDVNRTWGGLQPQPEISLQMGMQGMGYMHSDLGGFAGANLDNDLYVRWLQYGVFQPIFRPHAQEEVAAEPVFKEAQTKALAKQAIELRYRLMPYNYTMAFQNHKDGTPLMRPLFFEDDSEELDTIANTYLWGDDILVSPILKKEEKKHEVYFPKNHNWIDFYTGEMITGGTKRAVEVKENHIPTFVRAGAFIPMVKPVQNTKDYSTKNLEIHYYYDADVTESRGLLYDDDGETPDAYKKRMFELLKFEYKKGKRKLSFEIKTRKGSAAYRSMDRVVELVIHGFPKAPKKVKKKGKETIFAYNEEKNILTVPFFLLEGGSNTITIKN